MPDLPTPALKPDAASLRLCHAVGLATRIRVGRWVSIDAALDHLAAADRESEEALLQAAVASGLVEVNPGPVAHSVKLMADGLEACRAARGAGAPQNGRSAHKRQERQPRN